MTETQRAAMQQALEALEYLETGDIDPHPPARVAISALRAALAEQEQVRDQSDFGTWFCRLGKLADAYHETGRTHPARFKARGELMAHALDAVIGWRARSALEQQQPARQPLTDDQRGGLVMEHLGPAALTGGTMSVYEAFLAGLGAAERAHGITGENK